MYKKQVTMGFVCLTCKKVYKKHKLNQDSQGNWEPINYEVVCPQCGTEMYKTGTAFKAPKITDIKAWEKLKPLFRRGYKFNPGFGNPFADKPVQKIAHAKVPGSEFRKPARKRANSPKRYPI